MENNPERAIVLAYSPTPGAARALEALWAFDDKLAQTVRGTTEPMLGEIRVKWWHDAVAALDTAPPPPEPLLQALASDVVAVGVPGAQLAEIAEGWSEVLAGEFDAASLQRYARRGQSLFEAAGKVAGASANDPLTSAGQGWAFADLAGKLTDAEEAAAARSEAVLALDKALAHRWSRNGRALGAMAHLARLDLAGHSIGSPRRVSRALWHRMTGR